MAKHFAQDFSYLCRRELGIDRASSTAVMRLWAKFARQKLMEGQTVALLGMGTFRITRKRMALNLNHFNTTKRSTPSHMVIARVKFKTDSGLRKQINTQKV